MSQTYCMRNVEKCDNFEKFENFAFLFVRQEKVFPVSTLPLTRLEPSALLFTTHELYKGLEHLPRTFKRKDWGTKEWRNTLALEFLETREGLVCKGWCGL